MPKHKLPPRTPRSEGFLGIHFDFHANAQCQQVGRTLTRGMVRQIIELVKPDYIQCDCKGHPGFSSYPTKVGNPAPGFVRDQLRIWREVTEELGVSLVMHYSGVWDGQAVAKHPEWAQADAKGKNDGLTTSVFGRYVDELLIPQLKELRREYRVDGAWVDGDCWATARDYSRPAAEASLRLTGVAELPRSLGDPHWQEFTKFCREGFLQYLQHYIEEMRAFDPDMEITSNWAFGSFMPGPVSVDLPFLSGDYSLNNSVNTARWEARCLAPQGRPWDLMAWGFGGLHADPCRNTKSAEQLQRESATVLALGGGFQVYYRQNDDCSIQPWQMPVMQRVAQFCRERQAACHRSETVPQVGLHYSSSCYYRTAGSLFAPGDGDDSVLSPIRGVLQCLLDGQAAVDVLMDHHMRERMEQYPLLVLPEWASIDDDLRERYLAYVENGGSLLVIGARASELFADELGVDFEGEIEEKPRWIEHEDWLSGVLSPGRTVRLRRGTRGFGLLRLENDRGGPASPAASIRRKGKGLIAGVYVDIGARYRKLATSGTRRFLQALCGELFPDPIVQVSGSAYIDVVLARKDGRLTVNLINLSGPHADPRVASFEQVEPIGPLEVKLRLARKPKRIVRIPGGRPVPFKWRNGVATLTLPRLHIHDVLVVAD
jgi:hypothetical protein